MLLVREVPLVQSSDDLSYRMKEAATKLTDFVIMFVTGIGSRGRYGRLGCLQDLISRAGLWSRTYVLLYDDRTD